MAEENKNSKPEAKGEDTPPGKNMPAGGDQRPVQAVISAKLLMVIIMPRLRGKR